MTNEEIYSESSELLGEHRFGWIRQEVEGELTIGRVAERVLNNGRNAIVSEPYTPREKVALLIDAASRAIVDPSEMGDAISAVLRKCDSSLERAEFISEHDDSASTALSLVLSPSLPEARDAIRSALNELKELIRGEPSGDAQPRGHLDETAGSCCCCPCSI